MNALFRAILIWVLLMATESLQGAVRHLLLSPEMQYAVRQLSVAVGLVVIFAITWAVMPWLRIGSARQALAVGGLWALLTLGFELGLGRLMGQSWSRIMADYDLARGGLMPIGLLAMAMIPWLIWGLKAGPRGRGQ